MRAIVLGGGGSKGSYQIGAWQALRELGYNYDIITGTSIGALNGAFMATNSFKQAKKLWDNITINDIIKGYIPSNYETNPLLLTGNNLPYFVKAYLKRGCFDISPFIKLLEQNINPNKIKQSPYKFGIMTVTLPLFNQIEISPKEVPTQEVLPYLLASASPFPAFPACKINNRYYIDGGYADNLPIDLAFKLGAHEIIAIDLNYKITHPEYYNDKRIKYLHPSHDLGPFLHFDQQVIQNNMTLGYLDTMKYFKVFEGFKYTFNKINFTNYSSIINCFIDDLNKFNIPINDKDEVLFLKEIENALALYKFNPYHLYNLDQVIVNLCSNINFSYNKEERNIFKTINSIQDLYEYIKNKGQLFLMKYLNYQLYENNSSNPPFFHKEIRIVILFHCLNLYYCSKKIV